VGQSLRRDRICKTVLQGKKDGGWGNASPLLKVNREGEKKKRKGYMSGGGELRAKRGALRGD